MPILVIDDSADQRALVGTFLQAGGYAPVLMAESAPDAFKYPAVKDPASTDPKIDLILLDIDMPQIDGIESCRQIKGIPHLKDIPIVMVTGRTDTDSLAAAFEVGAVDYITKPVKKAELLARVRSVLRLQQEIAQRTAHERALERRTRELEAALHEVTALRGCLPMCPACRKVRDDGGLWNQVEVYLTKHGQVELESSLCPDCSLRLGKKAGMVEPKARPVPTLFQRVEAAWRANRAFYGTLVLTILLGLVLIVAAKELWKMFGPPPAQNAAQPR